MTHLTHLERYLNSINRKPFDRIPFSVGMTGEMANKLVEYTGVEYYKLMFDVFQTDTRGEGPRYIGPPSKSYDDGTYENMYGVRMRNVNYGHGTYSEAVGFPLVHATTVDEIKNYKWPRADMFQYEPILETLRKFPDYPFTIGYHALGWHSWEMRGMEKFMEDLYTEEQIADAIINEISDFGYNYFKELFELKKKYEGNNFTAIQLADDWSTQEDLLISPEMFRKFFKPHYKRIIDMAHSAGILVEFHCCGSQVKLIPDFIDLGVDILNPLQTSAKNMIPHKLKEEFGDYISFSGGVDVQTVFPRGTTKSVRDEVFYLLDTVGKDGGYILQPSHAIQVDTPPENVVAMVDAVYEYYGMAGTGLMK